MSGPKSSYYVVTSEQRRILAERRRREEQERRRREEQERQRREEQERQRREEQERQRREELERRRREEEERHRREEEEHHRREEEERRRREEEERRRREEERQRFIEEARQARIKQSDAVIDEAFSNFQAPISEPDKNLNLNPLIADLMIEYKVVCDMIGEPEKSFEFSQATIQNIKAEIIRLREKIARDDEKAYINKCLDEVMSDMGYDVIGRREVTKKSGKHFKSELFSYADGTAVNVTMADDGHIAMELCGLDEVDRTPDFSESEKLCEHMETFCEDFGEIERRLEEKGVILSSRIQRLPSSVEYAQILNVSDYEISGTVEYFKHKCRRDRTSQPLQRKN